VLYTWDNEAFKRFSQMDTKIFDVGVNSILDDILYLVAQWLKC